MIIHIIISQKFQENGTNYIEPNEHLFSFNNPFGVCSTCGGYGDIIGIDPDLVIPNTSLSVYDECIVCGEVKNLKNINNFY